MAVLLKYKPVIICVMAVILIFSFLGGNILQADEGHAEPVEDKHSILGSFFHFVGEVIAFPFRMVGKAFDAIF